jgi:hypothetical protein
MASAQPATESLTPAQFAQLSRDLSESGGYFDTDNLISNEASYLHVLGRMREMGVNGGAFIGVGPDQSFSYIAQIRPRIAFMVDIRRDNLLQHLFYKALFDLSRQRIEFLCLLFGRPSRQSGRMGTSPGHRTGGYIQKTPVRTRARSMRAGRRSGSASARWG